MNILYFVPSHEASLSWKLSIFVFCKKRISCNYQGFWKINQYDITQKNLKIFSKKCRKLKVEFQSSRKKNNKYVGYVDIHI